MVEIIKSEPRFGHSLKLENQRKIQNRLKKKSHLLDLFRASRSPFPQGSKSKVFLVLAAGEGTLSPWFKTCAQFRPRCVCSKGFSCLRLQLKTPPAASADLINSMFQSGLDKLSVLSAQVITTSSYQLRFWLISQRGRGLIISSNQPGEVSLLS